MPDSQAANRLILVITRALDVASSAIKPDTEISALEADALELADIVLTAEAEFGVVLTDEEIEDARTVGALAAKFEAAARNPARRVVLPPHLHRTAGEGEV